MSDLTQRLIDLLHPLSWEDRLRALADLTDQHIVFSTSFSFEDQAITHVIARDNLPVRVFTLDTGRLFEATHKTFQKTNEAYPNLIIETYYPEASDTENLVKDQGINGFYDSVDKRKACCFVRKVKPLQRALEGANIWISGLRREHSNNRGDLPLAEYDGGNDVVKLYPLIDVLEGTVRPYIKANNIPYNEMHEQGYPSIGCAPCTRAITAGEDFRAGRWWWEQDDKQECGLHFVDGKLVRAAGI